MHTADSFCCVSETDTTMQSTLTPITIFKNLGDIRFAFFLSTQFLLINDKHGAGILYCTADFWDLLLLCN